jgi:hypothetical protein
VSYRHINYVRDHSKTKGRAKFLLLVIATRTDDEGCAFPSYKILRSEMSRLDSNEWKTDDGNKRLSLSFVVEQLNFLQNDRSRSSAPKTREPERNEYGEPSDSAF